MISLHETCKQYVARRLSEGWRIISQDGFNVVLQSPEGIIRPVDLRNDVLTLRPNAAGDLTQFSTQFPATGSHYDKVDEVVPDDDSTYIESLDVSPYNRIYIAIKENGLLTYSPYKTVTGLYADCFETWTLRPSDSQPFTVTDINNLQIGVRAHTVQTDLFTLPTSGIPAGSTINSVKVYARAKDITYVGDDLEIRCTQAYVEVNYTPAAAPALGSKSAGMAAKMVAAGCI